MTCSVAMQVAVIAIIVFINHDHHQRYYHLHCFYYPFFIGQDNFLFLSHSNVVKAFVVVLGSLVVGNVMHVMFAMKRQKTMK